MYLNDLMSAQRMNRAELGRVSGIPESTLRDILNGRARIDRCEAGTLLCLADALNTTVEDIICHYWDECLATDDSEHQRAVHDTSTLAVFYHMVNGILARIARNGDLRFIWDVCGNRWIEQFYEIGYYRISLFLLGMIDYLNKKHGLKNSPRFIAYRKLFLDQPVYALSTVEKNNDPVAFAIAKAHAERLAIPELARFNIFMTKTDLRPVS